MVHQGRERTGLCDATGRGAVLDEASPLGAPGGHLGAQVGFAKRLADPAEEGVVRVDEEVRRQGREDRLEARIGRGEFLCVDWVSWRSRASAATGGRTSEAPDDGERGDDEKVETFEQEAVPEAELGAERDRKSGV